MRRLADQSYLILLDEQSARDKLRYQAAIAAGAEELPDLEAERVEFDRRLQRPLDADKWRTAMLEEVRAS